MKTIILKDGSHSLVDDDDYDLISCRRWYRIKNGYAVSPSKPSDERKKRCYCYMHRLIMNAPKGLQVDHINGDKLDNRRVNLRLVNNSQNHGNRGKQANNSSGYKGVFYHKKAKKWTARIGLKRKYKYLGLFSDPKDAYEAYLKAAKELHGEFMFHE